MRGSVAFPQVALLPDAGDVGDADPRKNDEHPALVIMIGLGVGVAVLR